MTERRHGLACLAVAVAIAALGCEEDLSDNDIAQFDRPQDAALVCYHADLGSLPMGCCRNTGDGVPGFCDAPIADAVVLAFVTQTTFGEVAVVDIEAGEIIDQDTRIPLNSFIPVGGQPSDIAASWDGASVYTANFETEDVSVIDVAESFGPTMVASTAIDVAGPAAKLAIARAPSIRDRFLFVTQPTLGRLAVIEVFGEGATAADGGVDEAPAAGRLLGWVRLDAATGIEHSPPDESVEGISPWAIAASELTPSLYVGGKSGSCILEIDSEVLVDRALALGSPGEIGEDAIVRRIDLGDFTTRALAVEPDLERWIYAVENELGGVVVVDLVAGEMLPVNAGNPVADDAYSIDVPGRARAISLLRLAEEDDPSPVTFNGTFGIVSSTMAAVYVIDAEDRNAVAGQPVQLHSLRPAADWCAFGEDAGTGDDDDDECVVPNIEDVPVLLGDDSELSTAIAANVGGIEVIDAGLPDCAADGGVEFRPDDDYGIRLRCDYRISSNEIWTLTWQGEIGVSGSGVAQFDAPETTAAALVVRDQAKAFCRSGVLGGDDGTVAGFSDIYDGFANLETGSLGFPNGYPGDLLEITSAPTPIDGAACDQFDGDFLYHVRELLADDTLIIGPVAGTGATPLPTQECFGQAFNYTIRSYKHWVLRGSTTGNLRYGVLDETTGQCLPDDGTLESELESRARNQRVFENASFFNYYMQFTFASGTEPAIKGGYDDLFYSFRTTDGFSPMGSIQGNDLTDIEPTPDGRLVLIDQASEGLILFDLSGTFGIVGSAVN
ncbi:MAG: hypothetical protein M0R80_20155 [Proteobacteria bacterium]|jgi:hypothetical protein|nr:hypothetical protein [Pseudomonadota bacterium]